jgi:CBS domain-containing protein
VTGWPDDLIRRAARLIARQHRIRLPVVGDDGNLLGIVARVDALQALAR